MTIRVFFGALPQLTVGNEVHIITGGRVKVKELLDKWNICYTAVFAILDDYGAQGGQSGIL